MISSLLDKLKPEQQTFELLRVQASDLRSIAICAISQVKQPHILLEGKAVSDYTDSGPLNNDNLAQVRDFEIRDGKHPVLGYHHGPENLWFCADYRAILNQCKANGWIK